MPGPLSPIESLERWHRRLCRVTDWLVLSGDLHDLRHRAEAQIQQWRFAGITAVVDVREEWSDEELVAEIAPDLRYWHIGTHDDGGHQDDDWFDAGLDAYREVTRDPRARLLVHCHMGINRGPSMGYRFLLEHGHSCLAALTAIRRARPIAAVAYAPDALDHFHRGTGVPSSRRSPELTRVKAWVDAHGIGSSLRKEVPV